jgi:hypothetical protein
MKEINFKNRQWDSIKLSYANLKERYKTVKLIQLEMDKGMYYGYFSVKNLIKKRSTFHVHSSFCN